MKISISVIETTNNYDYQQLLNEVDFDSLHNYVNISDKTRKSLLTWYINNLNNDVIPYINKYYKLFNDKLLYDFSYYKHYKYHDVLFCNEITLYLYNKLSNLLSINDKYNKHTSIHNIYSRYKNNGQFKKIINIIITNIGICMDSNIYNNETYLLQKNIIIDYYGVLCTPLNSPPIDYQYLERFNKRREHRINKLIIIFGKY
jgi:hypothetical protein